MMRIAVVGGGISGLGAAYELAKAGVKVSLYEKEDKLGGHTNNTVTINGVQLDLGFMLFNRVSFPNLVELFENLEVETEDSDMSFSVSLDKGVGCEWGTRNGLSGIFAQRRNFFRPHFWTMFHELIKFKDDVHRYFDDLKNNSELSRSETLDNFIKSRGYSKLFEKVYLIPMCASIWPCGSQQVMDFPAFTVLSSFRNNLMFQLLGGPQWFKTKGQTHSYLNKFKKQLVVKGCQIKTNCEVQYVITSEKGCKLYLKNGSEEFYDGCILAIDARGALKILGDEATHEERMILGAFQYSYNDFFLHQDKTMMPQNRLAWSACNFLGSGDNKMSLTYWLNVMQNIGDEPFFVTHSSINVPKNVLLKWSVMHPIPSFASSKASLAMDNIQGKRKLWFCKKYHGYGFHEDGLKAGMVAAHHLLGRNYNVLKIPKQLETSWIETGTRIVTSRFLSRFISIGCLVILEDGGGVLTFQGTSMNCAPKVTIRVHSSQFYSKVCMEADLGLADAYINGDFSLVDKNEGLLNLFTLFIANTNFSSSSRDYKMRGWWTPMLFTSGIASAKYFYGHFLRRNTITQARRNISRHYDMSNDMFSMFLDETMTYSCAIFKSANEDLKDAQLRKLHVLIEKAKVEKNHEVLDIGCGWGSLAIEIVRRTGCKYTGITLSEEQLRLAEKRVKEVGLQGYIKLLLCDYRQLPHSKKYDRIISCEMLEHVGHEYMEDFMRCCDSMLEENGLLVLQFSSIPDERYDEHIKSSDFLREYIFPGGFLPCLSRVTSAMKTATRLCVEQVENIGMHYYQTLRCWRQNFLDHQSKIQSLGFDEKFFRTWEYYFNYCAAGFKSRTTLVYQVVFSHSGNVTASKNSFETKSPSHDRHLEDDPHNQSS